MEEKTPIAITFETRGFERKYKLPTLFGSERQIGWARIIRHKWLAVAFDQILDNPNPELVQELEICRNDVSAGQWIDRRHHNMSNRTPLQFLMVQASARAAESTASAWGPPAPETPNDSRIITEGMIYALRSPAGGFTKDTLAIFGITWPPPKGWKNRLIGTRMENATFLAVFNQITKNQQRISSFGTVKYVSSKPKNAQDQSDCFDAL
jgi:hypothetical protein